MSRCQFVFGALVISLSGCAAWNARHAHTEIDATNRPSVSSGSGATNTQEPSEPAKTAPPPAPPAPPARPAPNATQPERAAQPASAAKPSTGGSERANTGSYKTIPAPVNSTDQPAPAEKGNAPALDLASLEQRLKDTHAIGVFTKLTLKNQVDDLLDQFRAFHRTTLKSPPEALRRQYEVLMLKVLSLLQNADPQLAAAISSSREAIWGMLIDPDKFAKI
jgi:hypothetical protein